MARERSDDPRYIALRAKLVATLLELAASTPAEKISVSQLTSAAGVSRTTFYSHADSPADLLAQVLVGKLQPRLAHMTELMRHPNRSYTELWRQIYLVLLDHVQAHREIYSVITEGNSTVFQALISCFQDAANSYVDEISAHLSGDELTPLWKAMAAQQQMHNMIAVIRAWMATDMADSPETVVDVYMTLAPPWQLAKLDEPGRIDLRRRHSGRAQSDA